MSSPHSNLQELVTIALSAEYSIKLGPRQIEILYHFAKHPGSSAYQISPVGHNSLAENQYRDVKDRINRLFKLGLVKKLRKIKKNSKHNANYYVLSLRGIYYLISSHICGLPHIFLKDLLRNYSSYDLFRNFIYPYMELETLLRIQDSVIFAKLLSYLEECCREIEELSYRINHTYNSKNGYITEQLFYWKNDLSRIEEEDVGPLLKFLKQEFGWKWVTRADIEISSDRNNLTISNDTNYVVISLSKKKDRAILTLNANKMFEFIVRPAIDMLILEAPTKQSLLTHYMLTFQISQQIRVQGLVFSILSAYGTNFDGPAIQILGQDKKFIESLQNTKVQFDKRFKLITENIKPSLG